MEKYWRTKSRADHGSSWHKEITLVHWGLHYSVSFCVTMVMSTHSCIQAVEDVRPKFYGDKGLIRFIVKRCHIQTGTRYSLYMQRTIRFLFRFVFFCLFCIRVRSSQTKLNELALTGFQKTKQNSHSLIVSLKSHTTMALL